jgi:phosphoserine phosphatase RsbU/P
MHSVHDLLSLLATKGFNASAAASESSSRGGIHDILGLFATTEVFVFVFMEVSFNVDFVKRIVLKKPLWYDYIFFILLFGGFSIFGTYTGISLPGGAISSIRDLGPLVAGLVGGPIVGLGSGLVGGIHRYTQGGFTGVACSLATVFAGLIGGLVYQLRGGKVVGIWWAALLAIGVEFLHGALAMLISKPFEIAWEVVKEAIPAMMVADGLGAVIAIIAVNHMLGEHKEKLEEHLEEHKELQEHKEKAARVT